MLYRIIACSLTLRAEEFSHRDCLICVHHRSQSRRSRRKGFLSFCSGLGKQNLNQHFRIGVRATVKTPMEREAFFRTNILSQPMGKTHIKVNKIDSIRHWRRWLLFYIHFLTSGLGGCHLPFCRSVPPCQPRTEERAGRAYPSHQSYMHFLLHLHENLIFVIVIMKEEEEEKEEKTKRKLVKTRVKK